MAGIPITTVADKVLHSWRADYFKHIEGDPARPVPGDVFIEYHLKSMTRTEFLMAISDAIEERLIDYTDQLSDRLKKAMMGLRK